MVFGKIAGCEAAKLVKRAKEGKINKTKSSSQLNSNDNQKGSDDYYGGIFLVKEPIRFRNKIQELMNQDAGIIRERTRLQDGLGRILQLKDEFYSHTQSFNLKDFEIDDNDTSENIVLTFQVKSSLVACEAIIRSALMRQESRGAHYRSDFPNLDDERWKVNIYCRKEGKETFSAAAKMVLFEDKVKEIDGPLSDFIKSHVKAAHHRTFE